MTPEQWKHLNARLAALEAFVIELARSAPDKEALQDLVHFQRELMATTALNSQDPNGTIEEAVNRVDELASQAWSNGAP